MKLLLDTHTALWWMNEHEKLSNKAKELLADDANSLYVSTVSVWEVAVKTRIQKLYEFNGGSKAFLAKVEQMPITLLSITPQYAALVEALPIQKNHRDPFDHLLVATAIAENMTILTIDKNIKEYGVPTVW